MNATARTIPAHADLEHRRVIVGDEPMVFHCHHYNCALQRSILDATYLDARPFLVGAAHEVSRHQLRELFASGAVVDVGERKALAASLYRWAGFGLLDLATVTAAGGTVSTRHSHYAEGWRAKWGKASAPVCFFAEGFLAGAVEAIYDLTPGSLRVRQLSCLATGDGDAPCAFELVAAAADHAVYAPAGTGPLTEHAPRPVAPHNVDIEGIVHALWGLPLQGDATGAIPAFGVVLTRHYANYYNRVSFEFERALQAKFGADGLGVAAPVLIEAGHVCAFHTFGGIMLSTEWDALVRPQLKTKADWVQGMVAAINALGWGRWQATRVSEDEAEFVLHDDYESVGHLAMYGKCNHPVSYLAQGGVAGLMNLVYLGDIDKRPTLDANFYDRLFKRGAAYRAEVTSSQAMGDSVTTFLVRRG